MRRRSPVEVDEPYNVERYNNFIENANVHKTTRSRSKSPPRKQQNKYNFVPLNENVPTSGFALNEINFEENQLPHYVVPVLYIPQRIITNEEFYASELYDKDRMSAEEAYQERPSTPIPKQSLTHEQGYNQNFQDWLTPSRHHVLPFKRASPRTQLTDSETDIYDELMAKLYGMEQPEEEIAVQNSFGDASSLNASSHRQLPKKPPEEAYNTRKEEKSPPNSSTSMRSEYKKNQAALRATPSPYAQEYLLRNPPCSPATSAYTVYPVKQSEYVIHPLVKDQRMEHSRTRMSPRESSLSRKPSNPPPKSGTSLTTSGQMQNVFNSGPIFGREGASDSKFTQTTADMSTDTETGDYSICKKSYEYMQKGEKGPIKNRNKARSLNCSNADVTLIIDRGSDENVYTVLGSGSQYVNLQERKFDKGTECLATVDLLPVASSTIGNVTNKMLSIPKLRTHSRPQTPRSLN